MNGPMGRRMGRPADFEYFIGIAGFWNGIPSLFRYRPALEYRPVTDFYGIPAEGYKKGSGVLSVCLEALMQALSIFCLTATYASRFRLKQVFGILMG